MVHSVPEVMIKAPHKLPYNYPILYPVDTGFQCCDFVRYSYFRIYLPICIAILGLDIAILGLDIRQGSSQSKAYQKHG